MLQLLYYQILNKKLPEVQQNLEILQVNKKKVQKKIQVVNKIIIKLKKVLAIIVVVLQIHQHLVQTQIQVQQF